MIKILLTVMMAALPGAANKPAARTIEMKVTDQGFEPNEVKVQKGVPLHLVVTRTTDRTCAKKLTIHEAGVVKKDLPLQTAVVIDFTPKSSGEIRYACGMDMVSGVLVVE